MSNTGELTLQIHCRDLPGVEFEGRTAVRLGIQKGNVVVEDVLADVSGVTFVVPLRVARDPISGRPNFLGPYAQGTPDARFIYLSWGERLENQWYMFRRAKIYLTHLDWETVERAIDQNRPIEAVVNVTDANGGPLCATVKSDNIEWKV